MSEIVNEINAYLQGGGLFNSELANHSAVSDLLIRCRDEIARLNKSKYRKNEYIRHADHVMPGTVVRREPEFFVSLDDGLIHKGYRPLDLKESDTASAALNDSKAIRKESK
jgi:hypothetical protein